MKQSNYVFSSHDINSIDDPTLHSIYGPTKALMEGAMHESHQHVKALT